MIYQKFDKNSDAIMNFDFEETRHVAEHSHPDLELICVLEGAVTVGIGRNSYRMEKDDILCIMPNKPHTLHTSQAILLGILHINYREFQKYLDTGRYYLRCNSVIDKSSGYQELRELMDRIFHLYYERNQEQLYLNSLYFSFLHTLVSHFAYQKEKLLNPDLKTSEEQRTNEIIDYINGNYPYPLSLTELAAHLNLSSTYLSKYIKKTLGKNFHDYLNDVRLSNAVNDMRQTEKSLSQISMDNGFPNMTAFTTVFRRQYGENPSAWLRSYRAGQASEDRQSKENRRGEHIRSYLEKEPSSAVKTDLSGRTELLSCSTAPGSPLGRQWTRLINIGEVSALMRSDLQNQLLLLRRELGIEYVRFWDVFTEQMLIDVKKRNRSYNFMRIDKILDFLIQNGMHPFIELGYKPIYRTRSIDRERTNERDILFYDPSEFQGVLYAFLAHCVNRYGLNEVRQWYFEQWGDPRITSGEHYGTYFELFEMTRYTIKSVSADIRFGGAGFGRLYSTLEFKEILELWKKRPCHPDFLSLYCYPYLARSNHVSQNDDRIQDPNFIHNQISMMREVMEEIGFQIPELLVTEYSTSVSSWNCLNDSLYQGAFILKTLIDHPDDADLMGYWLASDILSEYFDAESPLHGGNGLLSIDGIKKPSYYALYFAGQMGDTLLGKSDHALVSRSDSINYAILCHNYVSPNFRYYLKPEDEIDVRKRFLLFDESEELQLQLRLTDLPGGRYLIKLHSLNAEHGSVQDEWADMDYRQDLTPEDIRYLRSISTPKIRILEKTVDQNILELAVTLRPQEILLIHVRFLFE